MKASSIHQLSNTKMFFLMATSLHYLHITSSSYKIHLPPPLTSQPGSPLTSQPFKTNASDYASTPEYFEMLDVVSVGEKGCSCSWYFLIALLLLYILWDVNYFLRIAFTVGSAIFCSKRIKPDETTEIYGEWVIVFVKVDCFWLC